MAKLTDTHKRFVVQALARYESPQDVADAFQDEFGIEVHRAQMAQYDPTKASGKDMAPKWRELFKQTRETFKAAVDEIPIAQQAFRLHRLGKIHDRHLQRGNLVGAASILEQAAKEVGGAFTNRREHTGADGGPIEQRTVVADESKVAAAIDELERNY
ncbi:Phage protein [plant metagenome]|uniref:Phage protein n=1 Tax=plant metagenome TaxID=1297885 RepID=A0A484P3N1_9ZZZZ